jgi:hypothetical protein
LGLPEVFSEVVDDYTADQPQDDTMKWIGLNSREVGKQKP